MGAYPSAALQFQPPKSPLEQMKEVAQLKSLGAQQQLQQQEIQKNQMGIAQTQAINTAYQNALKPDVNGHPQVDMDSLQQELARAGHGSAIPAIAEGITKWQKGIADAQEAQAKVAQATKDAAGFLGYAIQKANYDPNLADLFIHQALNTPGLPAPQAQMYQQVRQQIQQNPQVVKTLADNMVNQSEGVRKMIADETQAAARMKAAGKQPEGENPLGDKIPQFNSMLQQRWNVLNPNQPLPDAFTLQPDATQKDFDRIDKALSSTEAAKGTKAQQDTANAIRQQTAQLAQQTRNDAATEKSYQFHSGALDKIQTPIDAAVQRLGRLQDTINQRTPQADALVAPELLTVMAGGAGSGLRMNEAEISRIVGGRTNLEGLKAALNKWQIDPSKGLSITPAQRGQIQAIVSQVNDKVSQKKQILDQARQDLVNAPDAHTHKQIYADAQKKISDIDAGKGGNATPPIYAVNPQTKQRIVSNDGGQTWQPAQ